jgi:DHA1 family multidrug resistance protein-like MFS transporter
MILRAVFMAGLIFIGLGISNSIAMLLTLRLFQGIFTGTISASAAFVASDSPKENISYSLGVITSSRFLGVMIGPAMGGFIAESFGYRTSFLLGGAMMFINGFIIYIWLKEQKQLPVKTKFKSEFFKSYSLIFKSSLVIVMLMLFMHMMTRALFSPYLALYVQEIRGMIEGSARTTGLISAFIAMMTAISSVIAGRLSSRYSYNKIVIYSFVFGIFMSIALIFSSGLYAFALFYGLMMFAIGGVEPVLLSIASEKVDSDKRGSLFGFIAMLTSLGWGLASVIGSIVSIRYSIHALLYIIPVLIRVLIIISLAYFKKQEKSI